MKEILNHQQMQQCDKNTMEYYGVISPVLMERAALRVAEEIEMRLPDTSSPVLIACGTGNNGGDGLAAARMLFLKGYPVDIYYPGNPEKASTEGARQLEIVKKYGIPVLTSLPDKKYAAVVDSIFGIGLSRDIKGKYYEAVRGLNAMDGLKIAVDISSGISADSGQVLGIAFRADLTVTFGFAKTGHILYPGAEYTGELLVRDMGIDRFSLREVTPCIFQLEREDLPGILPGRKARSNKGTYGKVAILAGSGSMAGAAVLSARAAYAAGAGLVRVVTPECNRTIIQNSVPEAVLTTYEDATDPAWLAEDICDWADVVAAGPGIGTSDVSLSILKELLRQHTMPLVLDADALNLLSMHPDLLESVQGCVLTPHLGEMARLTEKPVSDIQNHILDIALEFSKEYNVITVLKDARTVIASPAGNAFINTTGNNGMATGGSGDVLTGLLAGFLPHAEDLWKTAAAACFVHGAAGDLVLSETGSRSMLSSDLIRGIAQVLKDI